MTRPQNTKYLVEYIKDIDKKREQAIAEILKDDRFFSVKKLIEDHKKSILASKRVYKVEANIYLEPYFATPCKHNKLHLWSDYDAHLVKKLKKEEREEVKKLQNKMTKEINAIIRMIKKIVNNNDLYMSIFYRLI